MRLEQINVNYLKLEFDNSASYATVSVVNNDDDFVELEGTVAWGPDRAYKSETKWQISYIPTHEELEAIIKIEDALFELSHGSNMRRWATDSGLVRIKYTTPIDVEKGAEFYLRGKLGWYVMAGTGGLFFTTEDDDNNKENVVFGKKIIVEKTLKKVKKPSAKGKALPVMDNVLKTALKVK